MATSSFSLLLALSLLAACGDDDTPPVPDGGTGMDAGPADAGPPDSGPPDAGGWDAHFTGTRIPETEAEPMRAACAFGRGALPNETIGEPNPIGDAIPIDHFILLMQENRSFDHYFGTMPGVDGIPAGASNPDAMGDPVEPFHTTEYCIEDVNHGWNGSHRQYNDGANDGFVVTNDPMGERAMGTLDASDLPFYWDLYQRFAMSDHHHCSVLGPTWVNRFYYMSGTSFGRISNGAIPEGRETPPHVIFELLDERGIDWRIYNSDVPFALGGYPGIISRNFSRLKRIEQLYADLAAGELAPVSYVDPSFTVGVMQTDEHPPANPQAGQAFIRELVQAAMASPLWPRMAIILTYDEHGGFYDHVPPPEACDPGDYEPDRDASDAPGDFDRLGFRVPLAVISPYARANYVSDRVTDHSSILRLVAARFMLPAFTGRDANAWPLYDMFDFESPPFMTPPTDLAKAPVDEARMMRCVELFGDAGL